MPIANCFIAPDISQGSGNLLDSWALESGKPAEHMTINIMPLGQQLGCNYAVMANLLLPSLWSSEAISALQLGLARALAKYYSVAIARVQVITSVVESGRVVEAGEEVAW